ncbi:MAG TPA: protein kinase [Verrucomicrobiae bacterium]
MNEAPSPEVAVFAAAVELPAEQRGAYLDQACAGDSALRGRVEALLRVQDEADNFFDKIGPALRPTFAEGLKPDSSGTIHLSGIPTEKAGDRIGRYKLLQQIGEGGCGVVYMAEQEEPVRRRVALKVIKLGMDTKSVIARFEAERQALALMDHPNIAKVLDAGATETGRPYFVMELVRGIKITDYCDENNLNTSARLELFIQICGAIQHAHQKGIIHRDIKPSNILVADHDGKPVPKVIDFGIAKATTDQRLTDKTLFTAFEQFIGTPAYMSPEQAKLSGLDIDTRSDIYSLGVLLYELLTAKTPFEAKRLLEAGLDEIRRIIREEDPVRPSTRLQTLDAAEQTTVARHRQSESPKLLAIIRGDLDWIVMKCLEKDRSRRYETANGLAADIHHHLSNEPVVARPPSDLYRIQKLVGRNKLAFFSAAAVTLSLVLGIAVSTWQAVRATRAEREQRWSLQQAEEGRAAEATLRQAAEIREHIADARVLFDKAQYDQAEKALKEIPPSDQPEPEQADLLRLLGNRHMTLGQWKEAASDFSAVMQFDASDNADTIGLDFLRCGPVIIESGDIKEYRRFVHETIARFAGTQDPIMAERVCKICLLLPADDKTLDQLGPFYDVVTNKINEFAHLDQKRWACFSLAIFDYRRGQYAKAVEWSSVTLTGNFETYRANAHVIRAMSLQELGNGKAGQADFIQGREAISTAESKGLMSESYNFDRFDWWYGRILLSEAQALIEGSPKKSDETK